MRSIVGYEKRSSVSIASDFGALLIVVVVKVAQVYQSKFRTDVVIWVSLNK